LSVTGPLGDGLGIALGVLTGMLSGAFGVGGAVISTPGVRLLGASTFVAVGTTLPSILPGALAGTIRYHRDRLVDWRVVVGAAPAGVAGAVVGSLLSHVVPGEGHWLMVLTALLIGITSLRMARTPVDDPGTDAVAGPPRHSRTTVAGVGAGAGLLSGLLGLGGGMVLIPAFNQLLRMRMKETVATSLACVGLLAVPSTITHAVLGDIDWRLAFLLAVGVVPGARLGAALSLRASDRRLRLAVAGFLGVLSAVYGVSELVAALR
jgi:uncharacterized membrane protein YfcA